MSILSYPDLIRRLPEILPYHYNDSKVNPGDQTNPASIDIRAGEYIITEVPKYGMARKLSLKEHDGYLLNPKEFILCETYEYICVPLDLAIELRLKSSAARNAMDHSLAFWVDPNWRGILTMEIINNFRFNDILLEYKQWIAQLIVHTLTTPLTVEQGYNGKYNNATGVERAKE